MKVRVLEQVCQGHSMCVIACPEIFHADDDTGHASVANENVPAALEQAVRLARQSCPEGAIEIETEL
jgi:ferredoxin